MEILAYTPTTLAEAMHASRPTVYRWMRIPRISRCTIRRLCADSCESI